MRFYITKICIYANLPTKFSKKSVKSEIYSILIITSLTINIAIKQDEQSSGFNLIQSLFADAKRRNASFTMLYFSVNVTLFG